MSKAVLISIRPKWFEKICNGEKTIEVRKTRPKLEAPFKCYIYCTLPKYPHEDFIATDYPKPQFYGGGKVIGEFICDRVYKLETQSPGGSYSVAEEDKPTTNRVARESCLGLADMHRYLQSKTGYGWHIFDLKIYDKPKELSEFSPMCMYKNDDKSCQSRMISCSYQRYDYNPDGSINLVECGRTLERPPQSWCYVENMED